MFSRAVWLGSLASVKEPTIQLSTNGNPAWRRGRHGKGRPYRVPCATTAATGKKASAKQAPHRRRAASNKRATHMCFHSILFLLEQHAQKKSGSPGTTWMQASWLSERPKEIGSKRRKRRRSSFWEAWWDWRTAASHPSGRPLVQTGKSSRVSSLLV